MLKINNNVKRYRIPLITGGVAIGGIFLFQYLTFIPEYSSAEEISTPVYDESKKDTRTLSNITYMQEMTSGICERSSIEPTEEKQLIDKRDGKSYWVAKLKDGRCWMTQNLDLNITEAGLSAELSDMDNNWNEQSSSEIPGRTPPSKTLLTKAEFNTKWSNSSANVVQSYDPGILYCNGTNCNATNTSNNGHDAVGNYYSFNAATAGSGKNQTGNNLEVKDSICPRGWKLPISGTDNLLSLESESGSFGFMLAKQGVTNKDYLIMVNGPLYFVKAGFIYDDKDGDGSIKAIGSHGSYWSRTAGGVVVSGRAYNLMFSESSVDPANGGSPRYYGNSVRCVNNLDTEDVRIPEIDNPNVSVTVNPILTLEVSDKEVEIAPKTDEVMTGDFTATVSANQPYTISLSSAEGYDTALTSNNGSKINAITNGQTVEVGKNGWGIRVCNDTTHSNCDNYKGITPYGTNTLFYTSSTGAINKPTLFNIGIGINSDLPSGTYSTSILVTASQK